MNDDIEYASGVVGIEQARKWMREIRGLEKTLGRLPTDEDVFNAAKDRKSSFHSFVFNVNKSDAARAYYMGRVQHLMRSLTAIVSTIDDERVRFRLFVRTDDGYERSTEIQPESATAEAISYRLRLQIISAQRRAEAWRAILSPNNRADADIIIEHLERASSIMAASSNANQQEPAA